MIPPITSAYNAGEELYKYQLISFLGRGHFGEVWLATDRALGCQYAVKILNPGIPVDQRLREAQIGHRLKHNNLVHVHQADVIHHNGADVVVIAMDYLPQGSVIRKVNPANFLPLNDVLRVARDILQGLEYLHTNSFYHNDIKPENILVGGVGQSLLSDYGIVGVSSNGQPTAAPNAYSLHKAPEVITSGQIGIQTDVFQTGLTLYRLAVGLSALHAKQSQLGWAAYFAAVTAGKLLTKADMPSFVPHALQRVILRAVAADPMRRFQSALEMRRAIERMNFAGQWTIDGTGRLIGRVTHNEFRFEKVPAAAKFSVTSYRRNLKTGHEVRISDFSGRNLTDKQANTLIEKFVRNVVTGQ